MSHWETFKVLAKAVGELVCIAIVAVGLLIGGGNDTEHNAATGWSAHE